MLIVATFRAWSIAVVRWLLEPTDDSMYRARQERKKRALREANNVVKFGGRRRG